MSVNFWKIPDLPLRLKKGYTISFIPGKVMIGSTDFHVTVKNRKQQQSPFQNYGYNHGLQDVRLRLWFQIRSLNGLLSLYLHAKSHEESSSNVKPSYRQIHDQTKLMQNERSFNRQLAVAHKYTVPYFTHASFSTSFNQICQVIYSGLRSKWRVSPITFLWGTSP